MGQVGPASEAGPTLPRGEGLKGQGVKMTTTDTNHSGVAARMFPEGFLWGAATSAYQIEGGAQSGGRGLSVWDTFSHTPGKVRGGDTGDIACDFYNRSEQDLDLIEGIGLGAFRFSVSWPRVQPTGRGAVNQPGLDFYRSLVDDLQSRAITPAITLFHWDLPQALEDCGGWASRDTAQRFAEYAQIVAEAIGDVGGLWITLNEPQVVTHLGYRLGLHAPGHADDALAAAVTHHLLLAHGLAVAALRSVMPKARIGIALNMDAVRAANPQAAEAASVTEAEQNRIFLDPILYGRYPAEAREQMLPPQSLIADGDMGIVSCPIDFLGINYYQPLYVKLADPAGLLADEAPLPGRPGVVLCNPKQLPRTTVGWLVEPDGLYDLLRAVAGELAEGCEIYVTENGCAANDYVTPEGVVNDIERVEYLRGHLDAAWRAIQDGVPLAGYFCWSLLDNFEWGSGYQQRFGLVFVEFDTQRRIPKRSACFYQTVAKANALSALDLVPSR
jgi:beta-glucosidase